MRQAWWIDAVNIDEKPGDMTAVCSNEDTGKQSACPPQNSSIRARSILEKLIRLSLTNRLTDDQTKAVIELGNQLFQTSGSRSVSAADQILSVDLDMLCLSDQVVCPLQLESNTSLLADTVVQQTVSRIRNEVTAAAVQRGSTASMMAETVVQETLKEISKDLMASDILSPKPVMPDSTASDKAVQATLSSSSTGAAICTELTKFIVMNAVDIALSCARRVAAKQAGTDDKELPVSQVPRRAPATNSSLIDAFIDRLSNEVYGNLSVTARQPASDTVLAATRWIDDDLRRQRLESAAPHPPSLESSSSSPPGVNPFAEVLMNLAVHDRLGDLQKNFIDGREMIELATRVLKSHVQSRDAQHLPDNRSKASGTGNIAQF